MEAYNYRDHPPSYGEEIKQVPHNIEAEQSVLGSIFVNNRKFDEVADILEPHHFMEPIHGRLYHCAKSLIEANQTAEPFSIKSDFEGQFVGDLTISQYIGMIAAKCHLTDAKTHAKIIYDAYLRRESIRVAQELSDNAYGSNIDIPTPLMIEKAQGSLDRIQDHGGAGCDTCQELGTSVNNLLEKLKDPSPHDCVSTGLQPLDDTLCGGWQRGELHIVGGRSSMGKSAFIVSSMLKSARQGYECLCFSLEMTHDALAARCLSDITYTRDNYITYSDILKKSVPEFKINRLEDAHNDLSNAHLAIDDQRGISIANIHSRIRRYINKLDKSGRRLDLVVVDHVGLVRSSGNLPRHQELGQITDQLATIAKDFNIAVVALCQLNRTLEGRDNKRPELHDLRNSGEIEENAACVLGLYRPAYYLEKMSFDDIDEEYKRKEMLEACRHDYEVSVLKQRNGPLKVVELWCNMSTNTIRGR